MADKKSTDLSMDDTDIATSTSYGLKPTMDSIFAEVEKNLPSIDFEISDLSSEEDIPIFHRSLKTPTTDDDDDHNDNFFESSASRLEHLQFSESKLIPRSKFHSSMSSGRNHEEETIFPDISNTSKNLSVKSGGKPSSVIGGMECSSLTDIGALMLAELDSTPNPLDDLGLMDFSSKSRPKSVGSSASRTPQSSHPEPLINTWLSDDTDEHLTSDLDVEIPSPSVSPRSVKRHEVPELSPKEVSEKPQKQRKPRGAEGKGDSTEVISQYLSARGPNLSLDSIDIDDLVDDTLTRITDGTSAAPTSLHPGPARESDGPSLIQRLAHLSMAQSGTELQDIDPSSGALKRKPARGLKDIKTARNITVSSGGSPVEKSGESLPMPSVSKDLANLPRSKLSPSPPSRKRGEPETIFLDLRGFDENKKEQKQSIERVQRVLGISPQSTDDSSSDDDDDVGSWHEQRKKIKESLRTSGTIPEDLITKTRTEKPQSQVSNTTKPRTQAQKLAHPVPRATPQTQPVIDTAPTVSSAPASQEQADNKEKQDKVDAARRVREQRERTQQSHVRLGQRLDAVRPSSSDRGRYPCAEATPTVFDVDASFEPEPLTLPFDLPQDLELVLLSVHLSSTGEMVFHRGTANKSVDSGHGLSASYTTLVTWLLSLVPEQFSLPQTKSDQQHEQVPFYVVGLQQMYIGSELRLYVAVTPVERITNKDMRGKTKPKTKKRDELKDLSPFQQILTKYFSVNTLHSVCPWLQLIVSLEVTKGNQGQADGEFVYKPPLPNITNRPLSTFIQISHDSQAAFKVLRNPVGFFWQTVENDEQTYEQGLSDDGLEFDTQNTMSLIYKKIYRDPPAMMGILTRLLQEGFDLAGLRLLYPTPELLSMASGSPGLRSMEVKGQNQGSASDDLNHIGPIVGLAIRGTYARSFWLDAIGPSDPDLARKTDPNSLCALYGGNSREECLLFCPRNPGRILSELSRWFGGRVPPSGVIDIGISSSRDQGSRKSRRPSGADVEIPTNQPAATLTAVIKSDIIVAVSPLVSTQCMGLLLATCQRRGYQLHGIRRCRLSAKRAASLGLSGVGLSVFVGDSVAHDPADSNSGPRVPTSHQPVTLLLLNKENALHTAASLVEAFMVQMSLQGALGQLAEQVALESTIPLTSDLLFHFAPFSDHLMHSLGGDFSKVPEADPCTMPGYITPQLHTNPELEQIVVLTLTGHHLLKSFGHLLGRMLSLVPYCKNVGPGSLKRGLELLGIKWLPSLSLQHAKEITPFEVGTQAWKPSVHKLTSEPAVVVVLRGVDAFRLVQTVVATRTNHPNTTHITLETIISPTPEMAYRQSTLFFQDRELFPDPSMRWLHKYLPPVRQECHREAASSAKSSLSHTFDTRSLYDESIYHTMCCGPRPITTLLLCKSDVVLKHLPKLLRRIVQEGFSVVGAQLVTLTEDQAKIAVPTEDKQDEIMSKMHMDYLLCGPCLVLCLQRENAVWKLLDLLGPSEPKEARRLGEGYWRGMFGSDPVANGLHGSCDYVSAVNEVHMFFPEGLCCKDNIDLTAEQIAAPGVDTIAVLEDYRQRIVHINDQSTTSASSLVDKPSRKSSGTGGKHVLSVTPLTQTTCIVLTPLLFLHESKTKRYPFVEVWDYLLNKGFEMVGARMLWFTEKQAQNFLHLNDAGSFALVPLLRSGPSLVLALQRDNAVMAFDSLLGSAYDKESVFTKYGQKILRPKDAVHANRLLGYFFEELIPASHVHIMKSCDHTPQAQPSVS